uniref:Uncharacterized protein n=1 Tax=Aceria tosichella TaxID=561515 RepID=A0A6G1SN15_9ACAR
MRKSTQTSSSPSTMASRQVTVLFVLAALAGLAQARSLDTNDAPDSAVIPSPNQEFNYADEFMASDIQRTSSQHNTPMRGAAAATSSFPMASVEPQEQASNEASVPVYVSPFERAERGAATIAALTRPPKATTNFDDHQESSHAPPNYAPRPAATAAATANDLKTSASYGHHHHGHHGYDHSGWLDMGAWTGGKGSFGWYADYPVGGKHHGYGRK